MAKIESLICYYYIDPRLIYNCETWTNITFKDYASLRKSQLSFLRRALEIPRSVPTAALYLELGILPIKCGTVIRQLLFLKKILDKNENDPVFPVYREMIKYELRTIGQEMSWTFGLSTAFL